MRSTVFIGVGLLSVQSDAASPFLIPSPFEQVLNDTNSQLYAELSKADGLSNEISQGFFQSKVDHFNPSSGSFGLRYWTSQRHYKPGGPIIAANADQTGGEFLLPSLDYGILNDILKETNGLGVIVEQRYFGKSVPTPDFSTKNLQWLTLEQSLQDYIYFSRNVDLGLNETTSSLQKPWIWYGGGPAAFLRVKYPKEVLGAVASSAWVHAKEDFWEYWDQVRINGGICTERVVQVVDYLDALIKLPDQSKINSVKREFLLQQLTDHRDFMWLLSHPLLKYGVLQWNDRQTNDKWIAFCSALSQGLDPFKPSKNLTTPLDRLLKNYAKFIIKEYVDPAIASNIPDAIIERFSPLTSKALRRVDHSFGPEQDWRPFIYLKCTEYGLHSAAAPEPHPSLFSRVVDLAYIKEFCTNSFTDSPSSIPTTARVENVNKYGGSNIKSDNLLLIDDALSPWLLSTPHDPAEAPRPNDGEHYWLIPGTFGNAEFFGVNPKILQSNHTPTGIATEVPPQVAKAQRVAIDAIKSWLVQTSSN